MSSKTRLEKVLVLRKTKLGESDLIVTLLASDGSQIRAVAKGARKPQSAFSARLELFCVAEVLLAEGKSLDIVKEARLVQAFPNLHASVELSTAAAPIAELLWRVSQDGLPVDRLFDMACTALSALDRADSDKAPAVCAACLVKTIAFCGFRPDFARCVVCGSPLDLQSADRVHVSVEEGGVVCSSCHSRAECITSTTAVVSCAQRLLSSTFADIVADDADVSLAFETLHLASLLIRHHIGASLKSLNFMFTCGLF